MLYASTFTTLVYRGNKELSSVEASILYANMLTTLIYGSNKDL